MVTVYARYTQRAEDTQRAEGNVIAQMVLALVEAPPFRLGRAAKDADELRLYQSAREVLREVLPGSAEYVDMGDLRRFTVATGEVRREDYLALLDRLRETGVREILREAHSGVAGYLDDIISRTLVLGRAADGLSSSTGGTPMKNRLSYSDSENEENQQTGEMLIRKTG